MSNVGSSVGSSGVDDALAGAIVGDDGGRSKKYTRNPSKLKMVNMIAVKTNFSPFDNF